MCFILFVFRGVCCYGANGCREKLQQPVYSEKQHSQNLNNLTPRCGGAITWSGPTAPAAIFDTANCFVANFGPAMVPGSGYTWQNGWFYRVNLNVSATCPLDNAQPWGANGDECYAGHPPAGKQAFIFDDNFYFTP